MCSVIYNFLVIGKIDWYNFRLKLDFSWFWIIFRVDLLLVGICYEWGFNLFEYLILMGVLFWLRFLVLIYVVVSLRCKMMVLFKVFKFLCSDGS